jgi:hypothetical protein
MRGVRCLVLPGRPSKGLLEAARAAKCVQHVVLVSAGEERVESSPRDCQQLGRC